MASVFGFYTVEESIPQANNSFLIKAYDEDWGFMLEKLMNYGCGQE
jgi:hypothetical protein